MTKLSPMANSKQAKTRKEKNFKTHKDDHSYGFKMHRKNKQQNRWEAWD